MRKAVRELAIMFAAVGLAPLGPLLAASYFELAWQAQALAGAWAVAWGVWLASRLRRA